MYLVTGGHRNGFICLLVCPWGESLQTGYDHIYPNPSQVACVLQQEITHFFFFGFWLLLMHFNCSQMPEKKKNPKCLQWPKKHTDALSRRIRWSRSNEVTSKMAWRSSQLSYSELPYNTDKLVKGFVHIHGRILGTSLNIRNLKSKTETDNYTLILNKTRIAIRPTDKRICGY